jgi:hypothetical protein
LRLYEIIDYLIGDNFQLFVEYSADAERALSHSKEYSKGTLVKETDLVEERKKASAKVLRDSANQTVKKDERESVQGEIRTYFVVDTTGKINDPILIKSVEISLDDMALSI